jgi:hypothetical protein
MAGVRRRGLIMAILRKKNFGTNAFDRKWKIPRSELSVFYLHTFSESTKLMMRHKERQLLPEIKNSGDKYTISRVT